MRSVRASAPGSLMLMGEHAVLAGHPALILSMEDRLTVEISPAFTPEISIISQFGTLDFPMSAFPAEFPAEHRYVLQTLTTWFDDVALRGMSIVLTSGFPPAVGLGSSTAVVVALLKALNAFFETGLSTAQLFERGLAILRRLQGWASGADVAASLYEGCLFYHNGNVVPMPTIPRIEWQFSGKKVPSRTAIEHVLALEAEYREPLFERIHAAVLSGRAALESRDEAGFAASLTRNQKLMEALFLDTPDLKRARHILEADPTVLATKISGAGLGDGVIGFKGFEGREFNLSRGGKNP